MRLLQVTEDMDSGSRQETGLETGQQCGAAGGLAVLPRFMKDAPSFLALNPGEKWDCRSRVSCACP